MANKIKEARVRDLMNEYHGGYISFSKMVEKLNEESGYVKKDNIVTVKSIETSVSVILGLLILMVALKSFL